MKFDGFCLSSQLTYLLRFFLKKKPFIPYTGALLYSGTWAPIALSVRNLLVRRKRRKKQNATREILKIPLVAARRAEATHRRCLLSSCAPFIPTSPADAVPAVDTRCPTSPRTPLFHRSEAHRLVPARRSPPLSSLRAPRRCHPRPASAPSVGWTSVRAWNRSLFLPVRNPSLAFSFYSTGSLLPLYCGQSSSNLSRLKSQ
jgi:hypothetical protein